MKYILLVLSFMFLVGCATFGTLNCNDCPVDRPCEISGDGINKQFINCVPSGCYTASWNLLEINSDGTNHLKGINIKQNK
jgi:hypothetical protein